MGKVIRKIPIKPMPADLYAAASKVSMHNKPIKDVVGEEIKVRNSQEALINPMSFYPFYSILFSDD